MDLGTLPRIDEHEVVVDAPPDQAWAALLSTFTRLTTRAGWRVYAKAVRCQPDRASGVADAAGALRPGFRVSRSEPPREWALEGAHAFSRLFTHVSDCSSRGWALSAHGRVVSRVPRPLRAGVSRPRDRDWRPRRRRPEPFGDDQERGRAHSTGRGPLAGERSHWPHFGLGDCYLPGLGTDQRWLSEPLLPVARCSSGSTDDDRPAGARRNRRRKARDDRKKPGPAGPGGSAFGQPHLVMKSGITLVCAFCALMGYLIVVAPPTLAESKSTPAAPEELVPAKRPSRPRESVRRCRTVCARELIHVGER